MKRILIIAIVSAFLYNCIGVNNESQPQEGSSSFYNTPTQKGGAETKQSSSNKKGDAIFTHSTPKGKLYHHENYSFSYSEDDEQSEWVAYELTKQETKGNLQRKESFTEDPIVTTESAHPYEYRNCGYTRGHLAPAGDMKFDRTAMNECFYTSNISPQKQKFNAGIWNDLEMQVRYWAQKFNTVYVITGPILTKDCKKLSYKNNRGQEEKSDITIPKKFYKIVYDFSYKGKEKMIGFIIPQEGAEGSFFDYAVTVDEIEKETKIDFFHNLSKAEQAKLEGQINVAAWKKFSYEKKYNH
ncbi:MAG: DNA/RNA non-specific endonuclease [Paludibacteraceae bacterium]|nr:DNA/RNA non-specific endonuclease [Paludibacteraceae bacterium]